MVFPHFFYLLFSNIRICVSLYLQLHEHSNKLLVTWGNTNSIPSFYLLFGNIHICVSLSLQLHQCPHELFAPL